MKRLLPLMLCILLTLSLCAGLTGCGDDVDTGLVGNWATEIEYTNQMHDIVVDGRDDMDAYFPVEPFTLPILVDVNEDGTYFIHVDRESVETRMEAFRDTLVEGLTRFYTDNDVDLEEAAAESKAPADMVDKFFSSGVADQIANGIDTYGKYELEDDKLYLSFNLQEDPLRSTCLVIERGSEQFKVIRCEGDVLESFQMLEPYFPILLNRQ